MKTTTIQKWGNSYAVRLPKAIIDALHLKESQAVTVDIATDGRSISVTPSAPSKRSLKEMLALVTPESIHPETEWGPSVGKEIW
jgi:antitoxin MazE